MPATKFTIVFKLNGQEDSKQLYLSGQTAESKIKFKVLPVASPAHLPPTSEGSSQIQSTLAHGRLVRRATQNTGLS